MPVALFKFNDIDRLKVKEWGKIIPCNFNLKQAQVTINI